MPQKHNDRPKLVVAEDALRAGHSGWVDSIIENPFELAVGVTLYILRRQRWNRWRDMIDEGDARILPIVAVAGNAVMRKRLPALFPVLVRVRQRILLVLITNKQVMLGEGDRFGFNFVRRGGLATGQPHDANNGHEFDYWVHV